MRSQAEGGKIQNHISLFHVFPLCFPSFVQERSRKTWQLLANGGLAGKITHLCRPARTPAQQRDETLFYFISPSDSQLFQ